MQVKFSAGLSKTVEPLRNCPRASKDGNPLEYPNRRHGISEGQGTTRHVFGLLTRFLEENLSPNGVVKGQTGKGQKERTDR